MKKKLLKNPLGSKDWLPEEVIRQEFVRKSLTNIFELWGYQPIQTPILINRDTLSLGSKSLTHLAFNLTGTQGDILALRADLTTPIARVTAERFQNEKLPLRFYYVGKVFRYHARKTTNERELYQIGIELIGAKEGVSDLECLKIFIDSLKNLGIQNYLVVVNHSLLWSELFRVYGDLGRDLYRVLSKKDLVLFNEILAKSNLPRSEKMFWMDLIEINGGKEVIPQIKNLSKKNKKINFNKICSYFTEVFKLFESNVIIDLSYTNDLDYYSGIYFEALTESLGRNIGSGGRYDNLIGRFGFDVPAIGFSFCLEDLLLTLEKQGKIFPTFGEPNQVPCSSDIKRTFDKINSLQKRKMSANLKV